MTDDIDALLGGLHDDKQKVLKEQIKTIEKEIVEREVIGVENRVTVAEEVGLLRDEILNLRPPHEQVGDVHRKDRQVLEREQLDLTKELREERRDAWKDIQQLKREEREVEKELLGNEQRHKRTKELL